MSSFVSRAMRAPGLSLCRLIALPLVACGSGDPNDWTHLGTGSSGGTTSSGGSSGAGPSSGGSSGSPSSSGSSSGAGSSSSGGSGSGSGGGPSGSTSSGGSPGGGLNPSVAPGGNFNLATWVLELPANNQTIPTSQLTGPNGYHDSYFFTDPTDGSMTFWDPENGQTTPNSNYPRSELRETTAGGKTANWAVTGTHVLSATVKSNMIPDHVCVGQIHCGTGTPATTKPLLELFYYANGDIQLAIEVSPAGNQTPHPVGNVPLGTQWSYVISLTGGNTIGVVINGGSMQTWPMPSSFDQEGMYFKAGDYDQSAGSSSTVGAKVQFYALSVVHMP